MLTLAQLLPPRLSLESTCLLLLLSRFSHVRLCATLWTTARHAPLSMGFSRQEYWSGLPCLLQGIFLIQGSNPGLLIASRFFTTEPPGKSTCLRLLLSLQSCPTVCDPIDGSPPGSAVSGILQAGTLEWAAISFSNA